MRGRVATFEIPCAAGHDVVYGLARGRGDEIYLAPSNEFCPGLCASVFAFDTGTERFREVIDIRKATGFDPAAGLMPHSKIHLCLQSTAAGRVFAATHFTAPGIGQTNFDPMAAYRGKYAGCYLLEYDPAADRVVNHGLLVSGEGARIACLDERNHQYYFLSYPRNHLFRYDYQVRRLYDLGRVGQENSFGLEVDEQGDLFTSDDLGRILRYSLRADRLEALDLWVPLAPGRSPKANYIRRMIRAADGSFYGFGNKGMRMFRLDPRRLELEDLGSVFGVESGPEREYPRLPAAKALAQTDRGALLIAFGGDGVYSDGRPVPDLVEFDPSTRQVTSHGKFIDPSDGLPAWIPQCALNVPRANAVFFGMQQTVGQLRLWKVDAAPGVVSAPAAETALYRDHVAAVERQPFGASVEGSEPLLFLRAGRVRMHELGWAGEDRVIPAAETAIAALGFADDETLYGLTFGRRAHLFVFHPRRQNRFTENYEVHPWDLGAVTAESISAGRLFCDAASGRILIAVRTRRGPQFWTYAAGSENRRYRGAYHSLPHWAPVQWDDSPFQSVTPQGAAEISFENLIHLRGGDLLLATGPDGRLLQASLAGRFETAGLDLELRCPGLAAVGTDRVFAVGNDSRARLLRRGAAGEWREEKAFAVFAGLPQTFAVDPSERRIAVGTADGQIQLFDLEDSAARTLVRLPQRWKVRALAWQRDGRLHGFYGEDSGVGEAFCCDTGGTVRPDETGILQVPSQPRYWMCHRADAIAAGPDGEVYFGESDRIAHLFGVT